MQKTILRTIAGFFFLFTAVSASAKCGPGGINILSANTSITSKSIIVLEFYGYTMDYIPELNKKYPVYLLSGKEKISMQVVEVLTGEFMVTQVVLKPTALPKPGLSYELQIENIPASRLDMKQYNSSSKQWEAILFEAGSSDILSKPVFTTTPAVVKKTMVSYGCGPARWVYFNVDHKGQKNTLVRAKARNTATGKITEFYMQVENGMVKIGHGMCSGAFHFEGKQFAVSFSLADLSGQQSESTKEILFETPTAYTDGE